MNKVQVLLGACIVLSSGVMAAMPEENQTEMNQADKAEDSEPDFTAAVEEALNVIKRGSPQVHEDSLRVWKNFSSSSKPVNYTYRFWGRQIVLWLKEEKKMAFQTKEEVGEVFKVLWRKGLISKNAVVVLMADVWSYLVYLEGTPSWEKRSEEGNPKGRVVPISPKNGGLSERAT